MSTAEYLSHDPSSIRVYPLPPWAIALLAREPITADTAVTRLAGAHRAASTATVTTSPTAPPASPPHGKVTVASAKSARLHCHLGAASRSLLGLQRVRSVGALQVGYTRACGRLNFKHAA